MGISTGAAILGGAAISGGLGLLGSQNAASAQENAAAMSDDTQRMEFNTIQNQQKPYREAGANALSELQANMPSYQHPFSMSDFQQDPGYQFNLQQGQAAIQRSAAARGGLIGTGALQNLSDYSQNMASNEFGNAYNRYVNNQNNSFNKYATLAGIGQTANSQTAQAGMNMANNVSANQTGAGNAQAAGYVGGANAISGAIGSGTSSYLNYTNAENMASFLGRINGQNTTPLSGINAVSGGGSGNYSLGADTNFSPLF